MPIIYYLLVYFIFSCNGLITVPNFETNQNLQTCVNQIVTRYFQRKMITYVDMKYDRDDILKLINTLPATIISRNTAQKRSSYNMEYIITVDTSKDFVTNFPLLMEEPRSNQQALFLIIFKSLKSNGLQDIFDVLLNFQVNNVLVVNGTNEVELYTYNTFDNYNCGKKYDDIINLGKCLNSTDKLLYPDKLVTGLRNCTFKATVANWPPYAVDLSTSNDTQIGVEQYVLQIISELEGFKVKYTESYNKEDFYIIGNNMTFLNDLAKRTDFIFGGIMLTRFRADAYNFLCGHLPFTDDIRIFVQKAEPVTAWKNLFLVFNSTVWFMLIVTFICFFVLLLVTLRVKDKVSLFLVMLDLLFLHGNKMVIQSRRLFIFWVLYAFLINSYYQSSLVSFTENPVKNYQISTIDDLINFNIEPCISIVLHKYFVIAESKHFTQVDYNDECIYLMESLKSVSRTNKKFTVSLHSLYLYNKYLLYDKRGEETIYTFKDPMNKVIYAIYFNKGFPLQQKLNMHTIRLRENGLIDRYLQWLYDEREKIFSNYDQVSTKRSFREIFPWYILLVGYIAAVGLLLLEVLSSKPNKRCKINLQ